MDLATGVIRGSTIQEQTARCLSNIQAILEEACSSLDQIASVTVVLADEDDFAGVNEEWLKWFPSNPPARQGAKLPFRIPGPKVSIAAVTETCPRLANRYNPWRHYVISRRSQHRRRPEVLRRMQHGRPR